MKIYLMLTVVLLHLFPLASLASGVKIADASIDEEDFQHVSFTVSWEHAWNFPEDSATGNHDAVWVFLKYSYGDQWRHLDLSPEPVHLSDRPDLLRIEWVDDGKGVFLVPGFTGAGDVGETRITLQLREPISPAYQIQFYVGGIEMVHIPAGPFWLGDGTSHHALAAGDGVSPFQVTSADAIRFGNGPDELASDTVSGPANVVPDAWPKGYDGFYCMKYELSQQQYKDFLQTLTYEQQAERMAIDPSAGRGELALATNPVFRNGIRIGYSGTASGPGSPAYLVNNLQADEDFDGEGEGQARACNFLSWDDLTAYLDWACLRPMTEFEFEKVCRGPGMPQALEFAWGTDQVVDANTLVEDGTVHEGVTETVSGLQGLASHGYDGPQGPLRCGFAAQENSDRRAAGAGHYGNMELSGNLWEQCVVANPEGLEFTGTTGDGVLSSDGQANEADWPAANGAGHRGGAWNSGVIPGFRDLAISDRFYAALPPHTRRSTAGGRGAR